MKRTFGVPMLMWLMLAVTVAAFLFQAFAPSAIAESPGINAATTAETSYDWGYLATIAGATAATLLIVQYLKMPLDKWHHVPTRYMVFAVALIIKGLAQWATKGLTWPDVPILALNAIVIGAAAMGAYELTFAKANMDT